jgi:hypothetical protein
LLILRREMMIRLALLTHETSIRPCDSFDLVIGTGSGGFCALFRSRMRMTVDQSMDEYVRMDQAAFIAESDRP